MKAKYLHENGNNTEYIICIDNLVVQISSIKVYSADFEPESHTEHFPTNAEARRVYHALCNRLETNNYTLEYKEVHKC